MTDNLYEKSRQLATEIRFKFGFNSIEPVKIENIYKMNKISLIRKPLQSDISGIFLRQGKTEVVLVNTSKTLGHQNFTTAHELYHALFDLHLESRVCKVGVYDSKNESELTADFFATNLLMPEEGIHFYLNKRKGTQRDVELSDILYLEEIFQVSHLAMLIRLSNLKIITDAQKNDFLPNVRKNAIRLGFDDALYTPTEDNAIQSEFLERLNEAFERELITYSRYEELLLDADLLNVDVEEGYEDYVD